MQIHMQDNKLKNVKFEMRMFTKKKVGKWVKQEDGQLHVKFTFGQQDTNYKK